MPANALEFADGNSGLSPECVTQTHSEHEQLKERKKNVIAHNYGQ